jgi:peptidoglycan hydrolase FlgJ
LHGSRLLPNFLQLSGPEVTHSLPAARIVAENPTDPEIKMDIAPITALPPTRQDQLMAKAEELEATFLSEMLSHSGLGEMHGSFGGGEGEAQFASFLRQEQAKLIVQKGGLGLAELIFNSMARGDHDVA